MAMPVWIDVLPCELLRSFSRTIMVAAGYPPEVLEAFQWCQQVSAEPSLPMRSIIASVQSGNNSSGLTA